MPVAARVVPEDGVSLAAALPPPKNVDRMPALGSRAQVEGVSRRIRYGGCSSHGAWW